MLPIDCQVPLLRLLVAVGGHPFDRGAFEQLFTAMDGVTATIVDQPAAAGLMNPSAMAGHDVLVLYDMPGLDFRVPRAARPAYVAPDPALRAGFAALLDAGKGVLALHHALAGWPAWPEYGRWLGGRFLYRSDELEGRHCLDSGYVGPVEYRAEPVGVHAVTAGLPGAFALTDELYLAEVFEDDLTPLLVSDHAFVREQFWSAAAAIRGAPRSREHWPHPPASKLIGWTRRAGNSPLVYLQPGDGPSTYANPHYRRLVENAVRWLASPAARPWKTTAVPGSQ